MIHVLLYNFKFLLLIAASIVSIGILITIHELGHFCFAKLFGVRTPSFSIGMGGPVLFSKKIGDTEFKINAIPLGGYLEIAGQAEIGQGDQKEAHATDAGSFAVKPYWQKVLIMSGGVLFNFIAAFIVLIGLFWTGMPKTPFWGSETVRPIINSVVDNSTAQQLKLQLSDEIIEINGVSTPTIALLMQQLKENTQKTVLLKIKRDGQLLNFSPTIEKTGQLGVYFKVDYLPGVSLTTSIKKATYAIGTLTKKIFHDFTTIITKRAINNLASPLWLVSFFVSSASNGISFLLMLLVFFSINLVILNLLPLPITDGGQIIITGIETLTGKPLPEKVLNWLYLGTWGLLILLTIYLVIKDSILLFWPKIKALIAKITSLK